LARISMSVIQDRHGTYYVQQRVPERLQEAVARVLDTDKARRVFLKKSLGTKNRKEAQVVFSENFQNYMSNAIGKPLASLKAELINHLTLANKLPIGRINIEKIVLQ
jgi:hypothetical protein